MLVLTPRTVRNLAARGDLPRVKIGRSTRYRVQDVEALIARGLERHEPFGHGSFADEIGMAR